jgi:hypothetical protein
VTTLETIPASAGALTDDEMITLVRELAATPQRERFGSLPAYRPIAGSEQDQHVPDGASNPYWEIVRLIPGEPGFRGHRIEPEAHWAHSGDRTAMSRAYAAGLDRQSLCARYSWSIPSPGDIAWIAQLLDGRAVVEIGAGSGYWAWQLAQAGVPVAAYDPHPPGPENKFVTHRTYHPVLAGDHTAAANHPDRALMLCWPAYGDPYAKQALHAYRGDLLIYIGEGPGGCCADDRFHSILERDFEEIGSSPFHVTYWGIHCGLTAYRRRVKALEGAT